MDDIGLGRVIASGFAVLSTIGALGIAGLVLLVIGAWYRDVSKIAVGVFCGALAVYYSATIHAVSNGSELLWELTPPLLVLAATSMGLFITGAWNRSWWTIGGGALCTLGLLISVFWVSQV